MLIQVDYCCLEQDAGVEVKRGIDSLPSYIERSDALLTPIVEDQGAKQLWDAKTFQGGIVNLFEEYGSEALAVHKSRGWCRVEVFIAGNAPMHADCNSYFKLQGAGGARHDRAHVLYGEMEMKKDLPIFVLPPLRNTP